ncbi:thioredoxin family protein [Patescibacteria group bacterium]|nr:thioredoxin family protein [Patescibacteria group bacterium]MBU1890920.1 thioredoxin family protein [Patescibacteria group bacterium]
MSNKTVMVIIVILVAGGLVWVASSNTSETINNDNSNTANTSVNVNSVNNNESNINENSNAVMAEDNSAGRYIDYSESAVAQTKSKKQVLFFHAGWCPTCIAANIEFNENLDGIPNDAVLVKTDYDSQTELKKKYGITYQHTFVQIDESGDEITKWNGGGIDELTSNIK